MVWDISKMFALFSANYVQTLAMMPTASFPSTVIIVLLIIFNSG